MQIIQKIFLMAVAVSLFSGAYAATRAEKKYETLAIKQLYAKGKWVPDAGQKAQINKITSQFGVADMFKASSFNVKPVFSVIKDDKFIILTAAAGKGNDCHACGVIVGGFVFQIADGGLKLTAKNYVMDYNGSFGDLAGSIKEISIGKDITGLKYASSFMGQGYISGAVQIYAPVANSFNKVLDVKDTAGSNGGVEEKNSPNFFSFDSVVEPVISSAEWYDISVKTTGTDMGENNKIVPVNKTEIYHFTNGKYEKAAK